MPPTICLPRKKVQVRKECNSNHKKVNQFINTLVCDCSSCASQLPRRVTYRHKQSTFQYMLINFKVQTLYSNFISLVNFDKEGSKFKKKIVCVCVCGGWGGARCTDTETVCKTFFLIFFFFLFYFFNIFFFFFLLNFFF